MANIVSVVDSIQLTLLDLGPKISVILIVLGAIIYGLAQVQPAEKRGQWQSIAIGMVIGGIITAAIVGAASIIASSSATLLT